MKPLYIIITACCLSVPMFIKAQETTDMPKKGQVIARVNGEIITASQVSLEIQQSGGKFDYKTALQKLIDDKLIIQAAVKSGIKVSSQEVDKEIKEFMAANKLDTMEKLQQRLVQDKISMEESRQRIADSILRIRYINSKIGTPVPEKESKTDFIINIFVSPREMREFFDRNKAMFVEEARIKTRQIILNFNRANKSDQQSKAKTILLELDQGGDFAELATKYSELKAETGGDWGWTTKGNAFPKEVEDIIYGLAVGAVSPVIELITESSATFRIVKVEGKTGLKEPSPDDPELQQKIRRILTIEKREEGIKMLKDKLNNEADIQFLSD
jgi:parvulin-like peptidyl-prolyl isomerase